jgi:tRNA-dihydrouridine synthase 1
MAASTSSTPWQALGSPRFVASPMVDASEYAFRRLVRSYGVDLCFTPMLHAKMFVNNKTYRRQRFDIQANNPELKEGPTVAQFAGHDPEIMLAAALLAESEGAAGIDINLGCPQPIARRGHYGSALLRETDLIVEIIRRLTSSLTIPVSCKIRIIDDGGTDPAARGLQATLRLADQIEAAGGSKHDFITAFKICAQVRRLSPFMVEIV